MTKEKLDECNEIKRKIDVYKRAIAIIKLASGETVITIIDPIINPSASSNYQFCVDAVVWSIMQEGMLNTLNEAVSTLQKRFDSL